MKKVITYGTFDLFHKGHYNIIKRAKEYGDYLIVGVTSESYDIERGKLSVHDSLMKRIQNVKNTGLVDEIIIEEYLGQKIRDIIKYNIDTFVIGSDWIGKFDHLKKLCDVVYLDRTKNISSTEIRNRADNIFKMGIVTDVVDDKNVILETKYVSGIHVESVFSEYINVASTFCNKYELDCFFNDYNCFLESVDFVYIKTDIDKRYQYIKTAITRNKSVICDAPFSLDSRKVKELLELARINKVLLMENVVTVYLRAFTQLIWMVEGGVIGDIVNVRGAISYEDFENKNDIYNMLTLCNILIMKTLGINYKDFDYKIIKDPEDNISFIHLKFDYEDAIGLIEIGRHLELKNELVIIGKKGTITVDNKWWETGYFELYDKEQNSLKKYSFNFEGNGFRYIVQQLLIMLRDERNESVRLLDSESIQVAEIVDIISEDM